MSQPDLAPHPKLPATWLASTPTKWALVESRVLRAGPPCFCGLINDEMLHRLINPGVAEPAQILKYMQVGQDDLPAVLSEFRLLSAITDPWIYFADRCGLKIKFLTSVDLDTALRLESILTVGLEGYWSDPDFTGSSPLYANTIVREQALRLWWD